MIPEIYHDRLMSACVVVRFEGRLWQVPNCERGWYRRLPLNLSLEVQANRLTPAKDVDAEWLGIEQEIASETGCD